MSKDTSVAAVMIITVMRMWKLDERFPPKNTLAITCQINRLFRENSQTCEGFKRVFHTIALRTI